MSMLCKINNIPVFYNIEDAKKWGKQYGLTGTHVHHCYGKTGYMAADNHAQIRENVTGTLAGTNYEDNLLVNWAENKPVEIQTDVTELEPINLDDTMADNPDDIDTPMTPIYRRPITTVTTTPTTTVTTTPVTVVTTPPSQSSGSSAPMPSSGGGY